MSKEKKYEGVLQFEPEYKNLSEVIDDSIIDKIIHLNPSEKILGEKAFALKQINSIFVAAKEFINSCEPCKLYSDKKPLNRDQALDYLKRFCSEVSYGLIELDEKKQSHLQKPIIQQIKKFYLKTLRLLVGYRHFLTTPSSE